MENKPIYLVADVGLQTDTAQVHYVLRDRIHAQGLASHGRIAFVECSELDRKDALLRDALYALKNLTHVAVMASINAIHAELEQ